MTTPQHSNDEHGRVRDGVDNVKEKAREAARQASSAVETNPLGVLIGGAAVGAIVGAVLPRSQKEKDLLAPLGKRVGATAAAAFAAAKETGRSELDNLGLSKGAAKDQARSLLSNVAKAAGNAGKAAVNAGREQAKGQ
ncbi:hypothetical protein [Sphingomonas corticis]|jgi:hypothetical protein|uniref:YtxH domain-containing protein n=1 Tax=Sphingomonas corticis TaxID=2722791 RepID=A0ABX1CI83_9SPHN|nr:hypothetical protein [Sphingomonas corticis]NJR77079.1 hypothetical protein [Sphingomonas corticis]